MFGVRYYEISIWWVIDVFLLFFFRFEETVGVEGKWGVQESEVEEEKQVTSTELKRTPNEFKRKLLQM